LTGEIRFLALLQGFTVALAEKAGKTHGHMDTGLAKEVLPGRAGTRKVPWPVWDQEESGRAGGAVLPQKEGRPLERPSEACRETELVGFAI